MPVSRILSTCFFMLACLVVQSFGEDVSKDPTERKVEKARTTLKAETEKLRSSVGGALEKRVEAARKAGDKDQVDAINREIERFESGGPIPSFLPEVYLKKHVVMLQKMETTLEGAIKTYTKNRKDAEAESLTTELKVVRKVLKTIEIRPLIVGTWGIKMVNGTYTADMIFHADGSGYQTTEKLHATWSLDDDAKHVIFTQADNTQDRVVLPLDPRETKMINRFGTEFVMTKK